MNSDPLTNIAPPKKVAMFSANTTFDDASNISKLFNRVKMPPPCAPNGDIAILHWNNIEVLKERAEL